MNMVHNKMKVMAVTPQGIEAIELPKPAPGRGAVRVKVVAAAVNAGEEKVMDGDFVGRFLHANTTPLVLGWDFAGTVDSIGEDVTDLQVGDAVWGHLAFSPSQKQGTYSEFVTVMRSEISKKPDDVSFQLAAISPTIAMTGLQSLRDCGRLSKGGNVLIIGAAGGIGSVSVGIAKRLGAHVTAICSTKDVEKVKALGADVILDRKTTDPFRSGDTYDVIFDTPAVSSYHQCVKLLKAGGTYVTTLPDMNLITGMMRSLFSSKRVRFVQVASKREDLELVSQWLSDGLKVPLDSSFKISELETAFQRQTSRERSGRVVVDVDGMW